MKTRRILTIAIFYFICINLNAQVFTGGSFGFNSLTNQHEGGTTRKSSNYSFSLNPSIGKFLSEKVAIGFAFDISRSGGKTDVNTETKTQSSGIDVSPFLRYYAVKWNKFSVFGQGNIGAGFSSTSVKTGVTTSDGPKLTRVFLSVFPGLSYDLSKKFSLETSLHFLNFGYNYVTSKDGTTKDKSSNFSFGAGLDNIISLNAITIGAIYKF